MSKDVRMLKPLALAALSVSMVHAATAEPISPRDASKLLKDMGSTGVSIKWVNDETARIEATLKDYFFNVRLMNCNDEGLCASSMIFATFSMDGSPSFSEYQHINEYNDSYPFGRAFLLDSSDADEYVVGVDYSADISAENDFTEGDVDMFFVILNSFVTHMSEAE